MFTAICIAAASTALSSGSSPCRDNGRLLATPRPYPANIVDSTARPGFNGRVWIGREIVGGREPIWRQDHCSRGPSHYGAGESNDAVAFARVNTLTIAVNPWQLNTREGHQRYERSRNEWLRERGFVGGVRTFVNPAVIDAGHGSYAHGSHRRHIEPRATIRTVSPAPIGRRTPVRVDGSGVRCSPFYGQEIRIVRPCEVAVPLRMTMGH